MDADENDDILAAREILTDRDDDLPAAYAPEEFRPPRLLAKIATAGLLFYGVCLAVAMWVGVVGYYVTGQALDGEQPSQELVQRMIERAASVKDLAVVAMIASAVAFSFWVYRVAKNAQALKGPLSSSPGMAVGCFFIPIYNLWRPYQVITEIWRASEADGPRPVLLSTAPGAPVWFILWWLAWIISGFIVRFASTGLTVDPSVEALHSVMLYMIVGGVLEVVALGLAICVVWGITRRQERAAASTMPAARVVSAG